MEGSVVNLNVIDAERSLSEFKSAVKVREVDVFSFSFNQLASPEIL